MNDRKRCRSVLKNLDGKQKVVNVLEEWFTELDLCREVQVEELKWRVVGSDNVASDLLFFFLFFFQSE